MESPDVAAAPINGGRKVFGVRRAEGAEGGLKCDEVNEITKAELTSPGRPTARRIFIKFSTIRENLICQFNYGAGAEEGFGLDTVSPRDSPSIAGERERENNERRVRGG